MAALTAPAAVHVDTERSVDVEIVVPVHNEQRALPGSLRRLHSYLAERFPLSWVVTVADNFRLLSGGRR